MTPRTHWRSCHRATPSRPRCCCSFRTEPCSCCLRTSWGIWSAGRRLQGDRTRSGRRPGTWCWAMTWRSASGRLSHSSDRSSSSYWPTVDPRQKILVRLVEGDWTDSQSWITRTLNPPLIYAAICSRRWETSHHALSIHFPLQNVTFCLHLTVACVLPCLSTLSSLFLHPSGQGRCSSLTQCLGSLSVVMNQR